MWKALTWGVWLVLVIWWLSPQVQGVRDKVSEHNAQIQRQINE
jgi:hypothetical protein